MPDGAVLLLGPGRLGSVRFDGLERGEDIRDEPTLEQVEPISTSPLSPHWDIGGQPVVRFLPESPDLDDVVLVPTEQIIQVRNPP